MKFRKSYILITVAIVFVLTVFAGCGYAPTSTNTNSSSSASSVSSPISSDDAHSDEAFVPMELIGKQVTKDATAFYYYRDPVSDVIYIFMDGYSSDHITPMLHPVSGKPLTYKQYVELYKATGGSQKKE